MTAFTEEYYRTGNYANYFARAEGHERMAREVDRFFDSIGLASARQSALDFGCGPGFFAGGLAACGWNITGYDISSWAIDQAKRRDVPVRFTTSREQILKQSFNVAFALDSLEHLDPEEVHDTLASISTAAWFVRIPVCKENFGRYVLDISEQDPTHRIRWTKARWREAFARRGYRELVWPNLATIWDSEGVWVSLLARR